ncbi:protein MGARP-like isoform X4 [Hippocampus zosterae]|uniref:protein MGARP-like isoform X4 n=1 Tax=Hippocampus zosterae TaxID=109293 RepID=UPI00223DC9F2|nr:protein MGARP-like isoform X4 [Hippocampus zosterae]
MFACRVAWRRCGPLAKRTTCKLLRDGLQQRQMSSTPGGSGENILYTVLCGGALVGAVSYAFNTVSTDNARFNDRISEINARPKKEWTPKPWPPKSQDVEDGDEEEQVEEASEVAAADNEAETVVDEVAQIVVEGAEGVAEIAQEVAAAAQQVEVIADEVVQVAKVVEEAAHDVPQQVAVEDPKSNG